MKIINQLKAGRHIQALRSARNRAPEAVNQAKAALVAMGEAAIPVVLDTLSHGDARGPAMDVLEHLLTDETLGLYTEALGSPNPAIVTAVTKVLAKGTNYNAARIVELLSDPTLPKDKLEKILWERIDSLSSRTLVGMLPELRKDARAVVFRLLEKTPDERIVPDLVALIRDDDWWLRLHVARLLGGYDDPAAIKGLTELLKDRHKGVRLEAVAGIHRLKTTEAVPALTRTLRDGDLKVQNAAIDALVDIGDVRAVVHLLEVLKDESEHARRAAVEVLNAVATSDAIGDLVRALRDEDWWVRVRAADALGTLGGPKVVDGVVTLLNDPDDFIRRYAVEILNAVPSEKAVEPLIRALRDDDWWVRERSIDALAKTGDARAVEPLLELLNHDAAAAPHCIRGLGILGDTRALEKLVHLVESENDEIKSETVDALTRFAKLELSKEHRTLVSSALSGAGFSPSLAAGTAMKGREMQFFGPEAARPKSDPPRATTPPPTPDPGENAGEVGPEAVPTTPSGTSGGVDVNFLKLPHDTVLLDRFRVLRQIGKGGFGAIYLVEDSAIKEEIILKILNPQFSTDDDAIRRFVQELKVTRSITHQNVIRIYDFLDLGRAHAVSMEYFPGNDLGKIIYRETCLDPKRTLGIVAQICQGLQAAHDEGVIHRDIKPANVLVGENGAVKIVDFGLASVAENVGSRLTKSGLLIGTPEYMAPEQIRGSETDHRADIYSLGLVMYEMLSGRKPFTGETPVKILFQHLEGEAQPLRELVENIPENLEGLVARTMAKEPSDRPQTAMELLAEVEGILTGLADAA